MPREHLGHLLLALEILLLGVAQALGIIHQRVGGEAYQPVVGRTVLLAHEMHVVGGYDLNPVFLGEGEDRVAIFLLALIEVL